VGYQPPGHIPGFHVPGTVVPIGAIANVTPPTELERQRIAEADHQRALERAAEQRRADEISNALARSAQPVEIPALLDAAAGMGLVDAGLSGWQRLVRDGALTPATHQLVMFVSETSRFTFGATITAAGRQDGLWTSSPHFGWYLDSDGRPWHHTDFAGRTYEPRWERCVGRVWFGIPNGPVPSPASRVVVDRTGYRPDRWRHWGLPGGQAVYRPDSVHFSSEAHLRLLATCARTSLSAGGL
jgi:hypothetical protein